MCALLEELGVFGVQRVKRGSRRWGVAVGISFGILILIAVNLIAFEQALSGSDLHF